MVIFHLRNFFQGDNQRCNIKIRTLNKIDELILTFDLIDFILNDQYFLSVFVKTTFFDMLL